MPHVAADLSAEDISAAVRVLARMTREFRQIAARGEPDHGWSVPGPRPEEEVP